ncbi:hypothetical protein [Archangium primigenium]|uniref:hypothetical protein n=1 Tax=[Archangium] primigenium TaxID=2792470 RepID=UPI00195662B1|nr:hypothetical protein [Archangium primigenium]MBM7115479.1 hypothetical protein [Archangium primigenium]
MPKESRLGPVELLRHLALSLERVVVQEAASGLVRGAADGLREEAPEIDGQLRAIVQDALTVLGRLVHEAAEREEVDPSEATRTLAASAMQGMLEVLEAEWQDGGMPLHGFVQRLNLLLDGVIDFAHSRSEEIRTPRERAHAITEAIVDAAVERLHTSVPRFAEDLRVMAPLGSEVAAMTGRGLVTGIQSKLQEDEEQLAGLLHRAGREMGRGMAAGIREELASSPPESIDALGSALESLAERTAAATVRGASGALMSAWREAPKNDGAMRRMSRDVTAGVLEALSEKLKRPLLAMAGAGSVMSLALLAVRWRRA